MFSVFFNLFDTFLYFGQSAMVPIHANLMPANATKYYDTRAKLKYDVWGYNRTMNKVVVAQFLSLDGVCQAPGGSDEDVDGGFPYGGWQMPYLEEGGEEAREQIDSVFTDMDAMLLGRKTYDIFASYWPYQDKTENPVAAVMNSVPIYVASHADTLNEWKGGDVTHLHDLATEINEAKQKTDKDIIVWGSGDLVQTLIREQLVDEFRLFVYPLILDTGKKLFRDDPPMQKLELMSSQASKNGVLALVYRVPK